MNFFELSSAKWWIGAWAMLLLVAATIAWKVCPEWLTGGESASTTIRNLGLTIAAAVALPLAIWRSIIAERQADAAHRQSETALQNLLNERFHKGAEMLGHPNIRSVRLGGISVLARLASEYPETFHLQVMHLFAAFVVNQTSVDETPERIASPAKIGTEGDTHVAEPNRTKLEKAGEDSDKGATGETLPEALRGEDAYWAAKKSVPRISRLAKDVEEIMRLIAERSDRQIALEKREGIKLKLADAILGELTLEEANFSNIDFTKADLRRLRIGTVCFENAVLAGASVADCYIMRANFRNADMRRIDLRAARLWCADLRGTDLSYVDRTSQNLWKGQTFPSNLFGAQLIGADLRGADLSGVDLRGTTLTGAKLDEVDISGMDLSAMDLRAVSFVKTDLSRANLRDANLGGSGADLCDAILVGADLSGTNLGGAKLAGADLTDANISGADFAYDYRSGVESPVSGLTQGQLDQAKADRCRPPVLDGVLDALTKKPLVWNGRPLD